MQLNLTEIGFAGKYQLPSHNRLQKQ